MVAGSFTPEKRDELLRVTREAAAAFAQDMEHMREIIKRPIPDSGEIRRVSGTLRRLLIDNGGDLRKIAPPRVGRLTFKTLDNSDYYSLANKHPFAVFVSGKLGPPFDMRGTTQHRPSVQFLPPNPKENKYVEVSLDGFLSNRILCINKTWLTRGDTIKYIANTASGVHSGGFQDHNASDFSRLRGCITFSINKDGIPHRHIDADAHMLIKPDFIFKPNTIDPVVNELHITCYLLTESPDVLKLESLIRSELNMPLPKGDAESMA